MPSPAKITKYASERKPTCCGCTCGAVGGAASMTAVMEGGRPGAAMAARLAGGCWLLLPAGCCLLLVVAADGPAGLENLHFFQ
jgi:hypothetical protein